MQRSIPTHIFKAYDIRGIYPDELDETLAYKTGRAFAFLLQKEQKKEQINLVVARDMRISSPQLRTAVIDGITDQGVNVIDIGLASSPTFYYSVAANNFDGGLIVTASHNPKEYNGFKFVRKQAIPLSKDTGIYNIQDLVEQNNYPSQRKGKVTYKNNVVQNQIKHDLQYGHIDQIKPFTIVADPANSMGALYLDALFPQLPCNLIKMNFNLDGNFPAHQPDPLNEKNLRDLKEKVISEKADLGIATDGDGDRIFFIDEKGETVPSHILRGILAKIFLKEKPGATICYDIRPGKITRDMILENGGIPVVTRVGHSLIKEKMREINAYFAGESSGHYFLRFDHGIYEAPMVMILKVLEELSHSNKTFSELIQPYKKYYHSGEINSIVEHKDKKINEITELFKDAKRIDYLDGVTIEYDDFWFNIRPSNTEPLLRLNLEAVSDAKMKEMTKKILTLIRK